MMSRYSRLGGGAALLVASLLLVGCAPQLNRIEMSVQDNHDAIARM